MSILKIPTARVFEPLLRSGRYKGAFGGRGSGKSHFFGELLVETCQAERGTLAVCIREAQRTLAQSSKRLIESKIASLGIGSGFKLFADKIETPGDGIIIFRGMQAHCGQRLQLRLMRALETRARRNGWHSIVSDTTDNIASANNFIRAGYRLYQPQAPWAWPHTLYWRKTMG
ncbi:phage terminase large subunit [Bradyrhizobium sp. BRP22]|uniref:phage terminase large subunit n=1 Tax=Bradyrhizobium sp. BRP22 TaxID=2793821 RepID=UPI001CD46D80|nr:phage terminase large subunit [Bradyrhizobium sp. BRP22]